MLVRMATELLYRRLLIKAADRLGSTPGLVAVVPASDSRATLLLKRPR